MWSWATPIWAVLGASALLLQGVALASGSTSGKLSRHIERLRVHAFARVPLMSGWAWLTWHWFIEPRYFPEWRASSNWTPDFIIITAVGTFAYVTRSAAQKNAPWPSKLPSFPNFRKGE